MNALPASIESALEDAGFSSTEVVILKRLLGDDGLTLRQIAAKTGKSTGVLDQAIKKLVKKGIMSRAEVNNSPQYALSSMDAVLRWMEEDVHRKHQALLRRHANFESFVASLQLDRKRPEMQFFEGVKGIEQAYRKLLELGKEMLQYFPVEYAAEDDPMRDFRVQYFRERRKRGIFSRVIAHSTPLGRRFQSRDPFEYRQTLLLETDQCPFTFEKVIIGDTVACINHDEKRACFIRYPELAAIERGMFEAIWRMKSIPRGEAGPSARPVEQVSTVPVSVRTLSMLRTFFLSRTSLITLSVLAVIAAGLSYGVYRYTAGINLQRLQERVKAIAATGTMRFDPRDIEALQVEQDWRKPQWAKVVNQLKEIRTSNDDVFFVYAFRSSKTDPAKLEFIADSHSINPYANIDDDPNNNVDVNGDGRIDSVDVLQWPGQIYPEPPAGAVAALSSDMPSVSGDFYSDSWGTMISGYAPLKNAQGDTIAVLAVDISAGTFIDLNGRTFQPILFFISLFLCFVIIRLAAFNRSLFNELVQTFHLRGVGLLLVLLTFLSAGLTYGAYRYSAHLALLRIQERVKSVAATAALQFDVRDLDQLRSADDIKKPVYAEVIEKLNHIRDQNEGVKYIYIMRPTKDPDIFENVADADSLDLSIKKDTNGDSKIDSADQLSPPGELYNGQGSVPPMRKSLEGPVSFEPYTDQWGTFVSGWAPIRDREGKTVAILGIDRFAKDVNIIAQQQFPSLYLFLFLEFVSSIGVLVIFNRSLCLYLWKTGKIRRLLLWILLCAEVAYFMTLFFYLHTLNLMKDQIAERLMSIAATGASQFDPRDLEQLHWAKDMKTEAYQRVFTRLNEIRRYNKEVTYAYIFRKTNDPRLTQFVADADSNYNLPMLWSDFNRDGELDEADENVAPGVMYYETNRDLAQRAFDHPVASNQFASDQWGRYLEGMAPIKDRDGNAVAIFGVAYYVNNEYDLARNRFIPTLWFIGIFVLLISMVVLKRA